MYTLHSKLLLLRTQRRCRQERRRLLLHLRWPAQADFTLSRHRHGRPHDRPPSDDDYGVLSIHHRSHRRHALWQIAAIGRRDHGADVVALETNPTRFLLWGFLAIRPHTLPCHALARHALPCVRLTLAFAVRLGHWPHIGGARRFGHGWREMPPRSTSIRKLFAPSRRGNRNLALVISSFEPDVLRASGTSA